MLWGFDVSAPTDPGTGEKVKVDTWAYEPGGSMIPKRFKAIFTVRGEKQDRIIREEWLRAEQSLSK
jgi:hypothetical protein